MFLILITVQLKPLQADKKMASRFLRNARNITVI
jgi:hypothetical protein